MEPRERRFVPPLQRGLLAPCGVAGEDVQGELQDLAVSICQLHFASPMRTPQPTMFKLSSSLRGPNGGPSSR